MQTTKKWKVDSWIQIKSQEISRQHRKMERERKRERENSGHRIVLVFENKLKMYKIRCFSQAESPVYRNVNESEVTSTYRNNGCALVFIELGNCTKHGDTQQIRVYYCHWLQSVTENSFHKINCQTFHLNSYVKNILCV